jgi:hypothetical protein
MVFLIIPPHHHLTLEGVRFFFFFFFLYCSAIYYPQRLFEKRGCPIEQFPSFLFLFFHEERSGQEEEEEYIFFPFKEKGGSPLGVEDHGRQRACLQREKIPHKQQPNLFFKIK